MSAMGPQRRPAKVLEDATLIAADLPERSADISEFVRRNDLPNQGHKRNKNVFR